MVRMPRGSSSRDDTRAWVDVDLRSLLHNATSLAQHARVPLIPMVKANAYGLGAVEVTRALERLAPMAFGVSSIIEAEELRAAGIRRPIMLFTPSLPSDVARILAAGITPTLATHNGIEAWMIAGGGAWHLAIDTGMHRAGANWDALDPLLETLRRWTPDGAFTHFHSAELDDGSMNQQEERFRAVVARLPVRPMLLHAENSAAIVRRPFSEWDCVRPGIFLYGVGGGARATLRPEPVVCLRARILELRNVAKGESVSYGATWHARGTHRIATVACGYADGLRRHLSNTGCGLIHGARVPIVGAVTMDMTMLDVTGVDCAIGDAVTFIGTSRGSHLTTEDVAAAGGLSPYELLTGLRLRLPRDYRMRDE